MKIRSRFIITILLVACFIYTLNVVNAAVKYRPTIGIADVMDSTNNINIEAHADDSTYISGTIKSAKRFTIGTNIGSVSSFSASYITLNLENKGNQYEVQANCYEHFDTTPVDGDAVKGKVYFPDDPEYDRRFATVLYYGFWGPGAAEYTGPTDERRRICSTSWMLTYINSKGKKPTSPTLVDSAGSHRWDFSNNWLKKHYNAQDVPDGIAYFKVSTNNDSKYQSVAGIIDIKKPNMKVRVHKTLNLPQGKQGDAKIEGAQYGVYTSPNCEDFTQVLTLTCDASGNAESSVLEEGTYYVKETYAPEGTNLNPDVHTITIDACTEGEDGIYYYDVNTANNVIKTNVKFNKFLSATDYEVSTALAGCKFKFTLKTDNTQEYYTNVSEEDGICTLNDLVYGTYTVSEVECPSEALKVADFEINVSNETPIEKNITDESKNMIIQITKENLPEIDGKTDALVSGSYFTIYKDENCTIPFIDKEGNTVVVGPTDESGVAESKQMRTGTYYAKETTFPKGMDPNSNIPGEEMTYKDKVHVFSESNITQQTKCVTSTKNIKNKAITGKVVVRKANDNSDTTIDSPAKGAELELSLASKDALPEDQRVTYKAIVDADGVAVFENVDIKGLGYDSTIPYGKYILRETKASTNGESYFYFIQEHNVNVATQNKTVYTIVYDYKRQAYLKLIKKDSDTNETVNLPEFKFKIYRLPTDGVEGGFVSQFDSASNTFIDEFKTDENGTLTTPEMLDPGDYLIYETSSPKGYYIDDKYRLPEDGDLGKEEVAGIKITIDKVTTATADDQEFSQNLIFYYEKEIPNEPLKAQLDIYKEGLTLTGSKTVMTDLDEELYMPIYEYRPLKGAVYEVYTAEEIKYPDGTGIYVGKDVKVDTITTGEDGHVLSKELYPGKYYLKEISVPDGILLNPDKIPVTLTNEDKYQRVEINPITLKNDRQKFNIKINKIFEEFKYKNVSSNEKLAVFGIYAEDDILNSEKKVIIPKGALVGYKEFTDNNQISPDIEVPAGKFRVKEIYTSYPYTKLDEEKVVTVNGDATNRTTVEFDGGTYINAPVTRSLYMIKFSASSLDAAKNIGFVGTTMNNEIIQNEIDEFMSEIKGMTIEQVKEYVEKQELMILSEAKYKIYTDKECLKPLILDSTEKEVEITIAGSGFYEVPDLPLGTYYVKEVEAPKYYDNGEEISYNLATEPVKIVIGEEENLANQLAFRAMYDTIPIGQTITKIDVFTSDPIPNCTFEVLNSKKEPIYHTTTDKNGVGGVPLDLISQGETYYFHEIEAPDLYKEKGEILNTDYHKFVANYKVIDNKVVFDEILTITNSRPARNVLVKKIDKETGKPLAGCKFSIVLLDENGNEYVNHDGEKIYAVKDAVTDENGECLVEKVPAGSYRFIEVEAPEGYDLAEQDLEGLEFTITEKTPETLIFEVTNTGDIAIYLISFVGIVSLIGIIYISCRKLNLKRN